jgi:acetyl-CoA synthetase
MSQAPIESLLNEQRIILPSTNFKATAQVQDESLYTAAEADRLAFWEAKAKELTWIKPWKTVLEWQKPYAKWFSGGQLNACANCLDVHQTTWRKNKAALIWESEGGEIKTFTYAQLYTQVNQLAHALVHQFNVKKGDRVTLYLPLIPELMVAVLACARIGAIHSVVFGGFSAQSLKDRLIDSQSKVLITATGGYRRGVFLDLKSIADQALSDGQTAVQHVVMADNSYEEAVKNAGSFIEPEPMDSEDPLFILYTSGTTGKPKGIVHTTGGYLTHAKFSTKAVFDLNDQDIYWCTADIGWITGHTYVVYGPLANGATVFMYEGAPDYPDKDRFWEMIDRHKVTILYTAPTAIRAFMKWGDHFPGKYSLGSLRLLGSVGEPINPEAWMWYYTVIGKEKCPIVDTWWQTETGGIMITTLPGIHPMKPGVAGKPLPGISAAVVHQTGEAIAQGSGLLTLTQPWPSMLRGIWGDSKRYSETYWETLPTYFAGDGATQFEDGTIMVIGRIDDVLNVAGHRIGTMEVESALVDFEGVAEAAVVGMPDEIKGQAIAAFVSLKKDVEATQALEKELIRWVGERIGAIAKPTRIIFSQELPKTRSGKIMRRILKAIANNDPIGDTTTLANPDCVDAILGMFKR